MTPDELLRSKVGANIKRSLRRLWAGDIEFDDLLDAVQPTAEGVQKAIDTMRSEGVSIEADVDAVVQEMRLSPDAIAAMAAEMGLGERVEPECYLPTAEEIRMATARLRSQWTQSELESRLGGSSFGKMD
jgi:tRNA A58 N-methylase Trm61